MPQPSDPAVETRSFIRGAVLQVFQQDTRRGGRTWRQGVALAVAPSAPNAFEVRTQQPFGTSIIVEIDCYLTRIGTDEEIPIKHPHFRVATLVVHGHVPSFPSPTQGNIFLRAAGHSEDRE
jgi:hypothetical protein